MKLLIVEDNEPLCLTLKELFEDRGISVAAFHTVETAKLWLMFNEPSAVLTDFQLKEESGFAFISYLRAAGHKYPIFLMSGCLIEEVDFLTQNQVQFFAKPQQIQQLIEAIERLNGPLAIEGPHYLLEAQMPE